MQHLAVHDHHIARLTRHRDGPRETIRPPIGLDPCDDIELVLLVGPGNHPQRIHRIGGVKLMVSSFLERIRGVYNFSISSGDNPEISLIIFRSIPFCFISLAMSAIPFSIPSSLPSAFAVSMIPRSETKCIRYLS